MHDHQMELTTVIRHERSIEPFTSKHFDDAHKPAGIRLAKMLRKYEDRPSSELWRDIQSLSAEILRSCA